MGVWVVGLMRYMYRKLRFVKSRLRERFIKLGGQEHRGQQMLTSAVAKTMLHVANKENSANISAFLCFNIHQLVESGNV